MTNYGPPERVLVETEWFDGPRSGVANIGGVPHRFSSMFDEEDDEFLGTFVVWPIDTSSLDREVEQWRIFIEWNSRYEAGTAGSGTHPGHGGISARWDELQELLKENRAEIPPGARRARALFERIERSSRYESSGPDYTLQWSLIE